MTHPLRGPAATLVLTLLLGTPPDLQATEFHVSPAGLDAHPGTEEQPFRTLTRAQAAVRSAQPPGAVTVRLHAGTYFLAEPLVFGPEDSGRASAPVVWEATAAAEVVVSGGVELALTWRPWTNGIWRADVDRAALGATGDGPPIDQLFVNGERQPMARYPNYDPTVRHFNGYAADAFSPARAARWTDPRGGFIHAMHRHEWGDFHYVITGKGPDHVVTYEGGWQNNRRMGMHDQFRMVENLREELDAPGEWFYDPTAAALFFQPPAGLDLERARFEAVRLKHLIELRGTPAAPVRFLTLRGLTFRHAARTFMENREPLLRSDWTTYRGGAVFLVGTEDCTLERCRFDQVGGNAVFASGYNRRLLVRGSHIWRAGANGIAFVGEPRAVRNPLFEYQERQTLAALDHTPGPQSPDYPAECVVEDCLIHETGRVEKQTAPLQIAMARRITVRHCSLYDVPRAGINIGDGCWGGHVIEHCDVFDTVKETGDHGSFNSWGRDRYWGLEGVDLDTVTRGDQRDLPRLDAVEPVVLRHNRWRCDHGWDIDLDDGSSHYEIRDNLCLNGGIKLREGFYRVCENNVMVNNSFHPHVWYRHSEDVFQRNIVFTGYRPIRVPTPWGRVCDQNLLHAPGLTALEPAAELAKESGRDLKSLRGDAQFIDPARGDYRVRDGSPALTLGFRNFAMDTFGVRPPELKALARTPALPAATAAAPAARSARDNRIAEWRGARVKNVTGRGEVSAAGLPAEIGVGVIAVPTRSAAARLGLREGDVILRAGQRTTDTLEDLLLAAPPAETEAPLELEVFRGQQRVTLPLRPGPL